MSIAISGSTITFADLTTQTTAAFTTPAAPGFRNRIINGDMRIDQRNAGASVTPASAQYTIDRMRADLTQSSKYSVQQNAGSITPPSGFTNYLGVTSLSSYSVLTGDTFFIAQPIEGFNVADIGFGTASAKTVTLSFWVRSSLTGSFGGSLSNGAGDRSYPYTYSISSSNTWEYKTVTIAGDTSGTWLTNNGVGISVNFNLGSGSTYSGTSGAWAGALYLAPTGATSVVGTNGATFYITGVQLESGSSATEFERRPIGMELVLCQRYYEKSKSAHLMYQSNQGTTARRLRLHFVAEKRVAPSSVNPTGDQGMTVFDITTTSFYCSSNGGLGVSVDGNVLTWDASAEL